MAKTVINGYCEIKDGEFVKFGRKLEDWSCTTSANPFGKIVKCKVIIEYSLAEYEAKK